MILSTLPTLGLLKTKIFWNKGYDVIISVHDITDKLLSRDSNYVVDVAMWPTFGKCSISMWEMLWQPQFCKDLTRKISFLETYSLFKFNNLGLPLGTAFKLYTSEAKRLKLKDRKFFGLTPTFAEFTVENLIGGIFLLPILNRVKTQDVRKLGKISKLYRIITKSLSSLIKISSVLAINCWKKDIKILP